MWKGKPVMVGAVGGIPLQILHGFLFISVWSSLENKGKSVIKL